MSSAIATSPDFDRCHSKTAKWEGGWSNHSADPGGRTMYGITEAVFWDWCDAKGIKRRPVRSITHAEALSIYYANYWQKAGCEPLFPGVDLAVYDAAVNSGVSRARKWLLASVGSNDHSRTVKAICARRLGFVQSLAIWKTFGRGWANRIADIEATGVAWALKAMHDDPVVIQHLQDDADVARKLAGNQAKGGAAVSSTGTATALFAPEAVDQLASWIMGGLLAAGLAAVLLLASRMIINSRRAQAYARAAEAL